MLDKPTMLKLAKKAIINAPNEDWQGRGKLTLVGEMREVPITTWDKKIIGQSTVAFFEFEHPFVDNFVGDYSFIGFTLSAIKVGKKTIYDTQPVIGKIDKDNYRSNTLVARFCPQCLSLDSITSKKRVMGPECVEIIYKCKKCSYIDHDVMD